MARNDIQNYIKEDCQEYFSTIQLKSTENYPISSHNTISAIPHDGDETLFVEKNFECLLPTIILFLEQESISNVSMNLNVNFRRVRQENFTDSKRENFNSALFEANGKTFQNSPIHLMFYEKKKFAGQKGAGTG